MFIILYENEAGTRWVYEEGFDEFADAKKHLLDEGFIENNRRFERRNYNWITLNRASIVNVKVSKKLLTKESISAKINDIR